MSEMIPAAPAATEAPPVTPAQVPPVTTTVMSGNAQTPPPSPTQGTTTVTIPDNWKDILDPELKSEGSLQSFKTVQDLAKSFVNAQKMIGKNKVAIPDPKHATEEDWREFYFKAGLPKEEKDYAIKTPDGQEVDAGFLEDYRKEAYKLGVMPAQAQKLFQWYLGKEKEYGTKYEEQTLQAVNQKLDQYKQSSGAAYEKRLFLAKKTLSQFGDSELQKLVSENPAIGNNPAIIDAFYKIGERLFGETNIEGPDQVPTGLSPEEARGRWGDIQADKQHPYWNASHPNHKKALAEVTQLFQFMVLPKP